MGASAGAGDFLVGCEDGRGSRAGSYDKTPIVKAQSIWHHVYEGRMRLEPGQVET
jgi:hypothetical protein